MINLKYFKDISFWATLNIVLALIGYMFVVALFLPTIDPVVMANSPGTAEAITQKFTLPYRGFSLLLSLYVLFRCMHNKGRQSLQIKMFFFLFTLWMIRLVYDLNFRDDIIPTTPPIKIMIFVCVNLINILAIYKSFCYIKLDLALKMLVYGSLIAILMLLIKNPALLLAGDMLETRVNGAAGMNSVNVSTAGTFLFISLFCYMATHRQSKLTKFLSIIALVLALIVTIRSGSRGPVISLVITFCVFFLSNIKSFKGVFWLFVGISFIIVLQNVIMDFIADFSPVFYSRLVENDHGSNNARMEYYQLAYEGFLNSPVLGECYGISPGGKYTTYPHNTVLEAFCGLGFVGGMTYLLLIIAGVIVTYRLVSSKTHFWVGLIWTSQIIESMFSSSFYDNEMLVSNWMVLLSVPLYYEASTIKRDGLKVIRSIACDK